MNIIKLKRIFYLVFTLAVIGVLVTSCEREIIGVEENSIKLLETAEASKSISSSENLKKGKQRIFLKPKTLKAYTDYLRSSRKLSKEQIIESVMEVTLEELQHAGIIGSQLGGVIIVPTNPIIPSFGTDCSDPLQDVGCDCHYEQIINYNQVLGCYFAGNCTCQEVGIANCNFFITDSNCNDNGPLESCQVYYDLWCP